MVEEGFDFFLPPGTRSRFEERMRQLVAELDAIPDWARDQSPSVGATVRLRYNPTPAVERPRGTE